MFENPLYNKKRNIKNKSKIIKLYNEKSSEFIRSNSAIYSFLLFLIAFEITFELCLLSRLHIDIGVSSSSIDADADMKNSSHR